MKKYKALLLLIIPAIVFIYTSLFVLNQGRFHYNMLDPAYAYLFNGLNIANGKMDVGHIDHPGTTVQTAAGVMIKAIYIFSGKQANLSSDVLSDPERYLHIISRIWVFLACCILFYCGNVIRKVSGNIITALAFQSVYIVFFTILTSIADLRPEGFLAWGTLLFVTICFSFLHEAEISNRKMLAYAVKFGAAIAFLLVTKVTSLPLFIIPLFLLKKWWSFPVYLVAVFAAGILFLIPALSKILYFFTWSHKLLFHSGIYGAGKEEIIDNSVFKQNLVTIFTGDTAYALLMVFMLVTLLYLLFSRRISFTSWKNNAYIRLLVGIFITDLVCTAMVAKHFKYHYLIPGYGLTILGTYVSYALLEKFSPRAEKIFRMRGLRTGIVLLFISGYSIYNLTLYDFYPGYRCPKTNTEEMMTKYKNVPRLYVTYEFYSAETGPPLYFGLCYSGDSKVSYIPLLKKIYPGIYFYSFPENIFRDWENDMTLENIVSKNPKMLVSFYYADPDVVKGTLNLLNQLNRYGKAITLEKVYENSQTGEQFYELTRVGKIITLPDSAQTVTCDAETLTGEALGSTDSLFTFTGKEVRTDAQSHSGKYSLQLDKTNPYGFVHKLPADKKLHYQISVWRKSASGKGALVANGGETGFYQSTSSVAETGENGWNKLVLDFTIPENYPVATLNIGVWNEGDDGNCYFDDFTLTEY